MYIKNLNALVTITCSMETPASYPNLNQNLLTDEGQSRSNVFKDEVLERNGNNISQQIKQVQCQ